MLNLEVIAIGTKPPGWIAEGIAEYGTRVTREAKFGIVEIPTAKRRNNAVSVNQREEGEAIAAKLDAGARVVALDPGGKLWSTEQLAERLENWSLQTNHIQFIIGGPDGLSGEILQRSDERWSLSHLTFPHFLVRVLIAEQLYRALMLNMGHPYHK